MYNEDMMAASWSGLHEATLFLVRVGDHKIGGDAHYLSIYTRHISKNISEICDNVPCAQKRKLMLNLGQW